MSLDQLHYTWASRGIEGVNQFQIAALSTGLKVGPAAAAMPMVQRLCRYDPPRGKTLERPVSFGWLDDEGYRIAFRRLGLPSEAGRRGNFAAHFLVGSVAELTEPTIAALFGSTFWWDGLDSEGVEAEANREQGFELPQLQLSDLPEPGPSDEASIRAGQALLYGIFTRNRGIRIEVTGTAEELGAAISAAARLAPEALRGLSFSTYEGEPIVPFDVVGGEGAGSGAVRLALVLPSDLDELSAKTLDTLKGGSELSKIAARVAMRSGELGSAAEIWDAARRIVGLSQARTSADRGTPGLLAEPAVLRFACKSADGRDAVISAIKTGRTEVGVALRVACADMDPRDIAKLLGSVTEHFRGTHELAGCAAFAAVRDEASEVLDIALALALEDGGAAASLGPNDAVAVLARAAAKGLDAGTVSPLLRALRREAVSCAKAPQVPDDYVAAMFGLALSDPGDVDWLGAVVRARPALVGRVRLDARDDQRFLDVLRSVVDRLEPVAAGLCIVGLPAWDASLAPPALSRICDELAAALLLARQKPLAVQVLKRSGSSDAQKSLQVLQYDGGKTRLILDITLPGSATVQHQDLRGALVIDAFAKAVAVLKAPSDVAALWQALRSENPFEDEVKLLGRLMGLIEEYGTREPIVEALLWVALLRPPTSSRLISRLGKIRDSGVDELSLGLAARVGATDLSARTKSLKLPDRRCRRWWKRLQRQRSDGGRRRRNGLSRASS